MKWKAKAKSLVDKNTTITWEVTGDSPAEAEQRAFWAAEHIEGADTGTIRIEPMEEDRQLILSKLLEVLWLTRALYDVEDLVYNPGRGTVTALFRDGGAITANVMGDSGVAMIRDVLKQIC